MLFICLAGSTTTRRTTADSVLAVSLAVSLAVVKTRVLLGDDGDYASTVTSLDYDDFQQKHVVWLRKKDCPPEVDLALNPKVLKSRHN